MQYDVSSAKFPVIENVKLQYGYSNPKLCLTPKTARQNPPPHLSRTQASPGALAWIGVSKLVGGLPLYQLDSIVEKHFGVPFTSTTLAEWMIKGAERILSPMVSTMEQALYGHDFPHIDETTLQVLNELGRTAQPKSFIWYRVTGGNCPQMVRMHYSLSRAGIVNSQLLEEFHGYLQTNVYAGYNASASHPEVTQPGRWTHVRGKFDSANKACSPGAVNIARQVQKLYRDLYHLDNQVKEKPPDERKRYEQEIVMPQLDPIRASINQNQARAPSYRGLLSTAFTYIPNQ